jgi:hypothetical protein
MSRFFPKKQINTFFQDFGKQKSTKTESTNKKDKNKNFF